jgi:hypothetical protein
MYCDRTSVNQISKRLRYKSKHTRLQTEVCGYTNKIFTFGSSLRGFRRQSALAAYPTLRGTGRCARVCVAAISNY